MDGSPYCRLLPEKKKMSHYEKPIAAQYTIVCGNNSL